MPPDDADGASDATTHAESHTESDTDASVDARDEATPAGRTVTRRRALAAAAGSLALGAAGGYVAESRPFATDCDAPPAPRTAPTDWPSPHYDRGNARRPPAESAPDAPTDLRERWHVATDVDVLAPPVVAAGQALLAGRAEPSGPFLRAFALRDGRLRWTQRFEEWLPANRVLVAGDRVLVAAERGDTQSFFAFGAEAGERDWRVPEGRGVGTPTTVGGHVVRAESVDGEVGRLTALSLSTGETCWRERIPDRPLSRPAMADGTLVYHTLDGVLAVDADSGALRWRRVFDGTNPSDNPVVADGRAFVPTLSGELRAYRLDGTHLWTRTLDVTRVKTGDRVAARWFAAGAYADGDLYVVEERFDPAPDALHARDASSGAVAWTTTPDAEGDVRFTRPTVVGDVLYAGANSYEADAGHLVGYAAATGERLFRRELRGFAAHAPVVADGRVLVATGEGLQAFA